MALRAGRSDLPYRMRPLLVENSELARLDLCYLVLLDAVSKNSLIPQLVRVIGKEATLSFLDAFSGMTLKVPSAESVRKSMHDLALYDDMTKIDRSDAGAVRRAAAAYQKTPEQALEVYERVHKLAQLVRDRPRRR